MKLNIPNQVLQVLSALEEAGCRAYIVGACIRDLLRGLDPMDYDIITNADFDEMQYIFRDMRVVSKNRQRGEMMVSVLGMLTQVSTYRSVVSENDKQIQFTDNLLLDLAARDFSVNAIAYHPRKGFKDPFNGCSCISETNVIIKAIGEYPVSLSGDGEEATENSLVIKLEPVSCFKRNPITIMNALIALADDDCFVIDEITKSAILENKELILQIPKKQYLHSFEKLLLKKHIPIVLDEYREVFAVAIPEIADTFGFDTHEENQQYTLWEHIYKAIGFSTPTLEVRYAMLFHNLGKPDCFSIDTKGNGHFYGHQERSRLLANGIMERLGVDYRISETVEFLVQFHDTEVADNSKVLKHLLQQFSPLELKRIIQCRVADTMAKNSELEQVSWEYRKAIDTLDGIISANECWSLGQLAIKERDLVARGIAKNKQTAEYMLNALLELVIEQPKMNTAVLLLDYARKNYISR